MTETYSLSIDFTSGYNGGQFRQEILDDVTIVTSLIGVVADDDTVSIIFSSALSGPEQTALDAVVAAHSPAAIILEGVDINSVQTLSNKTFVDNTTFIEDNLDSTKKLKLELSGIATATTRTLMVPDADTTLVGSDASQTLINKTIDADANTITNIEDADIKAAAGINATKIANGTVDNTEFQKLGTVTGNLVGTSDTQVLSNKTLTDNTTFFQDDLNNTKKMQLELSAISGSTTRTLSVPDANTTIVGTDVNQVLTNKTIDADQNTISNIENADIKAAAGIEATKIADGSVTNAEFQRINSLTSPAVGETDTQILTNKTLTLPKINDLSSDHTYNIVGSELVSDRNATLPVLGSNDTFVFEDHVQTLADKTLTLPKINDISADNTYSVTVSELTTDVNINLPLLTTNDTFVFEDHTQTLTNKSFGDNVNMNSNKITNLSDPTADQDAATKTYVDAVATGLDVKNSCFVGSANDLMNNASLVSGTFSYNPTGGTSSRGQITATLTVSDTFTLDGYNIQSAENGLRVLIKNNIRPEKTEITTVADSSGSLDGTYFILYDSDGSVAFWIDVDNSGTSEPAHGASRSVEIQTITTNLSANAVASAIQTIIDADLKFSASVLTNVVTVTDATEGIRTDATANTSGFTITTLEDGANGQSNGIWNTTVSGTSLTLDRAFDFDSDEEVTGGAFTLVESGIVNGNTSWVLSIPDPITVGGVSGSNLLFSKFSDAGSLIAGTGMTKSGNTFNVNGSSTIIANADDLGVNSSSTANQVLLSSGSVGTASTFGGLPLSDSNAVDGILGFTNGGTGASSFTTGSRLVATNVGNTALETSTIDPSDLVTLNGTETLTNKTFIDASTYFQDDIDGTKQVQLQLSGLTTSTTRTLAVPDANTTLVGDDATQTLTNKTFTDNSTYFQDNSDNTKKVIFELAGLTTSTTRTITFPDDDTTMVGNDTTQTLTNKTFTDDSTFIQDNGDNSKKLQFDVSGVATSTTRTLTVPDENTTIVGTDATQILTNKSIDANFNTITNIDNNEIKALAGIEATKIADGSVSDTEFQRLNGITSAVVGVDDTQTLTNKTLIDNTTFIQDNSDSSKKIQFEVSGLSAATTRTLTAPNANTTLVGTDATQILTNKTFGDELNMGNNKILNVATPVAATDGANKGYVDSVATGLTVKDSVAAASTGYLADNTSITGGGFTYNSTAGTSGRGQITATLTASNTFTVDGVTFGSAQDGSRILLKNNNRPEITQVTTVADSSNSLDGKYFLIYDDVGDVEVWINTSGGSATAPGVAARAIEVNITTNNSANDVASAIQFAVDGDSKFTASISTNEVTITDASDGIRTDASNVDAGFTVTVQQQGGGQENGVWITTVSGTSLTLDRADDFDEDSEVTSGSYIFIDGGSNNVNTGWILQTSDPITIGGTSGTSLKFAQFSSSGQITAGDGLTKSGVILNVGGSTTIIANADDLEVNSSGTANQILLSSGTAGTAATYGALPLANTNSVAGVLALANGGTGVGSFTAGSRIIATNIGNNALETSSLDPSTIPTLSGTETFTNKSFIDGSTYIVDEGDNTKKMQFQVSGITTSTTRTITIPNEDTIMVGTDATQTLTNKTIDADLNTLLNIDNSNIKAGAMIDASKIADGSVSNAEFQLLNGLTGAVVGVSDTQTLTNKTFVDNSMFIEDNLDGTKKMQFQLSGITTSTTRTLTVPDANTTIVGTDTTQVLTNKTMTDSTTLFQDNTDNTKKVRFEISGISTSTTRVITFPDGDTTVVGDDTTQTISNKTFIDDTTFFRDELDATKHMKFQLSGVTSGQTRTITIPDVSTTLVGTGATQTLTNKTIDADLNTLLNIDNDDIKAGAQIDASKIANGSVTNAEFQLLNSLTTSAVGLDDTQTLTNKTLVDSSTFIENDADGTKKVVFELSSLTTATTRVVTFPDDDIIVVGTGATQTLSNKTLVDDSTFFEDNGDSTKKLQFQLSGITTSTTRTVIFPDANTTMVGTDVLQTLTNKTLVDSSTLLQDDADNTKQVQFQLSNITTSQTRTMSFPDEDGVLVGEDTTQIITNKTFTDDSTLIQDNSDNTRKARFEVSGISSATTRVFTFPDATTILVGDDNTQTLSNKTMTLPKINDTSLNNTYNITVSEITTDIETNLPLLIANDTFVFEDHIQTLTNKTLDNPVITSNGVLSAGYFEFGDLTPTPPPTPTNAGRLYKKAGDTGLYWLNENGEEINIIVRFDEQIAFSSASVSTSSSTFATVPGMILTTKDLKDTGRYFITFTCNYNGSSSNTRCEIQIRVDGTSANLSTSRLGNNNNVATLTLTWTQSGVGSGTIIDVQFRKSAGSGTVFLDQRTLIVRGVPDSLVLP